MRYINHRMYIFFLSSSKRYTNYSTATMFCITTNILFHILFFWVFSFLLEDITYQSASRDLSKSLLNNFSTQRKNIKQNVKFGSHIFYPFPTRNTRSYESNNIYNVCNNTEINIKKRCYTKQVYSIRNFSIILFSIKGNVFSSKLAMWLLLCFFYTSPLWYNTRMTTRPRPSLTKH